MGGAGWEAPRGQPRAEIHGDLAGLEALPLVPGQVEYDEEFPAAVLDIQPIDQEQLGRAHV